MKFDILANSYMRLFTESLDASSTGPFSLYWKNEEEDDKANKWYTANTLRNLLQQVNQDNITGDFEYGMVDEDREFMSVQELLDYCDNSSFFITDGRDKTIAGTPPWHWDSGNEEDAEEKKVKTVYWKNLADDTDTAEKIWEKSVLQKFPEAKFENANGASGLGLYAKDGSYYKQAIVGSTVVSYFTGNGFGRRPRLWKNQQSKPSHGVTGNYSGNNLGIGGSSDTNKPSKSSHGVTGDYTGNALRMK